MSKKADDVRRCVTPMGRISFPKVFKAESYEGGDPKYACTILFDKDTDLTKMKKAVRAAKLDKWGAKDKWPKRLRSPFRDGNEKEDLDGYADKIYITASNTYKPQVVDRDPTVQITEEDDSFYAGCYGRLALRAFAYDVKGNKGVSFSLENVQKIKDGERFSGLQKAEDVFDEIEDDDEDFDDAYDDDSGF